MPHHNPTHRGLNAAQEQRGTSVVTDLLAALGTRPCDFCDTPIPATSARISRFNGISNAAWPRYCSTDCRLDGVQADHAWRDRIEQREAQDVAAEAAGGW